MVPISTFDLRVDVFKAVRAPLAPAFARSVLMAVGSVPEVAARLAGRGRSFEVAVRLTGDRELRRLNRSFLGEDHATDVLSFPSGDGGAYLGDLAVSWPYAVRQAAEFGHEPAAEVALLLVHGFLHLLGWDHPSVPEEEEMNRVTRAALAAAGVRIGPARLTAPGPQPR